VAGPEAFICDQCAEVAVDIVRDDLRARRHAALVQQAAAEEWPHLPCALCGAVGTSDTTGHVNRAFHHATLPDGKVVCAACVARIIGAVDEAASHEP
jgi:hypothetical protein